MTEQSTGQQQRTRQDWPTWPDVRGDEVSGDCVWCGVTLDVHAASDRWPHKFLSKYTALRLIKASADWRARAEAFEKQIERSGEAAADAIVIQQQRCLCGVTLGVPPERVTSPHCPVHADSSYWRARVEAAERAVAMWAVAMWKERDEHHDELATTYFANWQDALTESAAQTGEESHKLQARSLVALVQENERLRAENAALGVDVSDARWVANQRRQKLALLQLALGEWQNIHQVFNHRLAAHLPDNDIVAMLDAEMDTAGAQTAKVLSEEEETT